MRAAPDALLDDGLLDILALESVSKTAFVTKILPKVFSGKHTQEPGVRVWRAREVAIVADRPFEMYADGDPIGELPLRVRALAGAVQVLVPESVAASAAFGAPSVTPPSSSSSSSSSSSPSPSLPGAPMPTPGRLLEDS